ncbi:MAG: hypothetical protein U1E63_05060 [Burkholderiales bacterium]
MWYRYSSDHTWNEENQWEPLWNDAVRVAGRLLSRPTDKHHPHFLGAAVLQQVWCQTADAGAHDHRRQQRLTTLQLLLDALHAELHAVQAMQPAMRIESLVTNPQPFCAEATDRFKVWPTNRDRAAFIAVMAADPPVDYGAWASR